MEFPAVEVLRAIRHATSHKRHRPVYGDPETARPGLWWVKDEGIYLLSNAKAKKSPIVYAKGFDPKIDRNVWDRSLEAVGGDDFLQFIPIEDVLEVLNLRPRFIELHLVTVYIKVTDTSFVLGISYPRTQR